jgi:hypothetical protein
MRPEDPDLGNPEPHTVIVSNALTNDFVGRGFEHMTVHVGRAEADRVIGTPENDWNGSLSIFLKRAVDAQRRGKNVTIIGAEDQHDESDPLQAPELIRYGVHSVKGTEGGRVAAPVREIYERGNVEQLDLTSLAIPLFALRDAVKKATGIDIFTDREHLDLLKWVVVGTHTNIRVFNTADVLRNQLGCHNVVVCPHLTASSNLAEHNAALKTWFPSRLVRVMQSVGETCNFAGIEEPPIDLVSWTESCEIQPKEVAEKLNPDQRAILETIFMGYDSVVLKTLKGGFSGSLLFMGEGIKQGAKSTPVVVKVDKHLQIKREIDGYSRVKDYLGMHVPAISDPVSMGEYTGVKIDFAALKGAPSTFQALFEKDKSGDETGDLEERLGEVLKTLTGSLYENTMRPASYKPFKQSGLDNPQQQVWLRQNMDYIVDGSSESDIIDLGNGVVIDNFVQDFDQLKALDRPVTGDFCAVHGDLNFANVMTDQRGNDMYIDWTHAKVDMAEIDFAKMENEIKFTMSKDFTDEDMPQLAMFEDFLMDHLTLPDIDSLPENLDFVKNDVRFAKAYKLVLIVRDRYLTCLRNTEDAEVSYKTVLLRYATHTLSFDQRRGKGECDLPALKYALYSTSLLVKQLKEIYGSR